MDVYLIRHGKTKGNLEGRYIGTTDEPLCEEGKQSLMQMADAKKYPAVEALFVSPMLRCRESAKILFPKQSISVVSDLRECDFGRYENKNFQELSGDADYQRWLDSNGTLPFPAQWIRQIFSYKNSALPPEETGGLSVHIYNFPDLLPPLKQLP